MSSDDHELEYIDEYFVDILVQQDKNDSDPDEEQKVGDDNRVTADNALVMVRVFPLTVLICFIIKTIHFNNNFNECFCFFKKKKRKNISEFVIRKQSLNIGYLVYSNKLRSEIIKN